jgi:hypothetical protein
MGTMTNTAKYRAYLRNAQGCIFDVCNFSALTALRTWARGRGGTYHLIVELSDGSEMIFTVKNNRLTLNK